MKIANRFAHKRRFRSLLWREDGAVTVFAVIVMSSLLLFFSLLIDYARIAALHKLTEDAVRSGVRSVLSAYDSTLYDRYGLFGRGGTDGGTIFTEVIAANTEADTGSTAQTIKLVRSTAEESSLHAAEFLGSHDVFSRQVLEEMKYKAPVDFTIELASKFAPMAGAMKEASVAVGLLEQLRKLYEKREAHLAKALQLQEQAAAAVSGSGLDGMIPVQTAALAVGGDTLMSIASEYAVYASQVKYDESLEDGAQPRYTEEINAYEEKARKAAILLRKQSMEMLTQHETHQLVAIKELEAARAVNEEMQQLVQKAKQQSVHTGYDMVSSSSVPGAEQHPVPTSAATELQQVKDTAEDIILPDSWFSTYKEEIDTQGAASVLIDMEAGGVQSNISASLSKPIVNSYAHTLLEGIANLRLAYGNYQESYIRPATVIEQRRQTLKNGNVQQQIKQQEEQASSLWKQARSMLQSLTTVPQSEEHIQVFEQVKKHYDDNLLFNQQSDAAADAADAEQAANAHEAAEQSNALMGDLFTGIGGMLERSRDTFYFGEYVINRYSSFAPQNLKEMMTSGDLTELSHAISFNNQESEYVLYGFHNPVGNVAAAYGELFAARLAIRTMEGLIESRSLGHPLLILSAALIYGLEKTMEDMLAFTERGSAPVSKYIKAELSYSDYLRLFMLIHSGDEASRLARMIAVIEQNSGATLSAVPSAVTGETRMSMELWFVPGLMRTLGHFGLLEGKVVGNRYETTQTIGLSY